jgi:parallel beta-helix repeat protein
MKTILLALLTALSASAPAAVFHVAIHGKDTADGSSNAPWRTIQRAADSLKPGDITLVGEGTYRERVDLKNGGTAGAPVTIAAAPGARVVVSGADLLGDGWTKIDGIEGAFSHGWSLRFPINGPNDLTHPGDKEHELTGRAEQVIHEGRLLRQVLQRTHLAPGTFFVDLNARKLLVRLRHGGDPARTDIEAAARGEWLAGRGGVSHVRVRGLTFRHAANHAQRGAFRTGAGSRGWVIEDCVFERANGPGATFTGDGHVIRRCVFQDNGQLGFGAWACHRALMEDCGIYRNNTKGYSTGWEAGGLKITMSRGFVLRRCRAADNRGVGIWFDIGNEQSEVAHCHIAGNDEAGIFYEISYGLHAHDNLVVNNASLGEKPRGAWGAGGITLSSSEDCVIENNTLAGNRDGIAFREQNRTTPRIDGGERRVFNRNHIIRRNLISSSQAFNIAFWMDTTFFGPHPGGHDKDAPISENPATLNIRFENNLLHPLPGRPNYLYGCTWRPGSRRAGTPAEFTALSGLADSSTIGEPHFADLVAQDFRVAADAPPAKLGLGVRNLESIPQR